MKLTTAVLAAGAALSLTTAVVGAARFRQDARHQAERNDAVLARNQLDWLAQMSTNPDLAKLWTPEDMDVEEYMQLLQANQLICMLSLRDRLGFVRAGHLPWYASKLMESDVCRRYWHRFGDFSDQPLQQGLEDTGAPPSPESVADSQPGTDLSRHLRPLPARLDRQSTPSNCGRSRSGYGPNLPS